MQANVNLDTLLEKMKAELERGKGLSIVNYFKKAEECLKIAEPFIRERERAVEEADEKRYSVTMAISLLGAAVITVGSILEENNPLVVIFKIIFYGGLLAFPALFFLLLFISPVLIKPSVSEDETKQKINDALTQNGIDKEECRKVLERTVETLKKKDGPITLGFALTAPILENAVNSLEKGSFEEASDHFKKAKESIEQLKKKRIPQKFDDISKEFSRLLWEESIYIRRYGHWETFHETLPNVKEPLSFAARACDALYLGDVEKMRELLSEAREMLDERDKFVIGDVKFFKYLFEFHYFLLKTVVEAYEAETGAVAKLTEEQAKRFAEAKPVEVPTTVEKVSVSADEPERELYRGEVRFKMGAMSQERVGTLVITNKRLKLTGKYRLRGYVATVAVKAALRAAGIGEVYEDIPLNEISWIELKKALLGGYYLEFRARGKKFTLYTDAAQHIYNILRQYSNA